MLRLFPLRRSFSLDLAPDDSNSNFLLHANDDSDLNGHSNTLVGAHLFSSQLPVTSKSSHANPHSVLYPNMSTAVHWPVDDIDDALAADFDGSLSGLGIELGTASFNMSEALMALPSLSSLKHQEGNSVHQQHHLHHHSTGNLNSNLLLASSLQANLSLVRNHDLPTSLERTGESGHLISTSSSNLEEKPVAVVHGKKNRLAYSEDDHEAINSSIKRFCLQASSSGERDLSNVHILLANGVIPNGPPATATVGEDHHQCNDDCFSDSAHCHLRHSSSVPDLRANFTVATTSPANAPVATNSAASSPSSSTCTSNPSTSFFSQILSSQINNLSSNCHASPMTHELAHSASRHTSKFQYVLGASTSMAIKMHEETMTYLNQGQSYEIKLKKVGDLSEVKGKMLKTILRVCFHDRRLQYMEKELIDQWKEQRPTDRILEVDIPLSYGIHEVRNDAKLINRAEFYWDPTKETGVFIRINCISTEFTPKKHGGEKGVPFRVVIETRPDEDPANCLHAASCQVKVFKPKGADRKHKTDREKLTRKPLSEQEKYQPSYDCTVFTDGSLDAFNVYSLPGSIPSDTATASLDSEVVESSKGLNLLVASKSLPKLSTAASASSASSPMSEKNGNCKPYAFNMFSDINENSFDLNFSNFSMAPNPLNPSVLSSSASSGDTVKWLKENRFDGHVSTLAQFAGADILVLSKEDLIQICGLSDGIRLFNALHSKSIKSKLSLYICSPNDDLFRAVYLDSLTVSELQSKIISNLLKPKCNYLKRLCIVGPSGVKILMTDDVVRNLADESLYIVELSKDYNGEFHAVMKPYTNSAK